MHNYIKKHLKGDLSTHQKPSKHTFSKITLKLRAFLSFSFRLLYLDKPNENSPTPITTPLALQTLLKKLLLHGMDDLRSP